MAASEQLAALIAERDKLWQVVEALLAPQPPAVPRSLSPSGQAAPSFTLFSLDGVGGGPSPPASPRSVRPAQATSPTTASKVVDDAGGHVLDLLFSLLAGADGRVSSADLRRLGKTLPPGSPRGGGEERRYDLADFQRLLGAGRRKGGEGVKFALGRRQSVATTAATEENILPRASGAFPSKEWRVDFFYEGIQMSPWHDIPVYVGAPSRREVHMVVEIPKWTRDKFEVCTTEHLNPIKQDVEEGDRLRVYDYGDMLFNYGMIPQTYEDPTVDCPHSGLCGDDDPLDIIDLGHKQHPVGKVVRVRVLGILGMIDDGQTDWKVLGISTSDPLASCVHTLADAEREMPGAVRAATLWLRRYKVLKKGKENTFLYDGVCQDEHFAMQVIDETHAAWERMLLRAEAEAAKEGGGLAGNSIARARSKGSSDRLAQLAASEK